MVPALWFFLIAAKNCVEYVVDLPCSPPPPARCRITAWMIKDGEELYWVH
jgi:hypothetical protein